MRMGGTESGEMTNKNGTLKDVTSSATRAGYEMKECAEQSPLCFLNVD